MNITIIGAGAWGTALALAFEPAHKITLCARNSAEATAIRNAPNGHESPFLPGFILPNSISIADDLPTALDDVTPDLLIIATPVAGLRPTLVALDRHAPTIPFIWVCKGLEQDSALFAHQVVAAVRTAPLPSFAALSGPSFAEEVARGMPTALTLASCDLAFAKAMTRHLNSMHLRIYAGDDLIGVELGGALKNVLAIATGICDGLGLGLNARAALITRGLAEMSRLGLRLGAKRETFMGLSGIGDLILTATGDLSRNRRVGLALASGQSLAAILADLGHVAEGVSTTREMVLLAQKNGIEMPITQAVAAILRQEIAVKSAVEQLLTRDSKNEFSEISDWASY